jgi:membrane-associated phospholipid phosphatase
MNQTCIALAVCVALLHNVAPAMAQADDAQAPAVAVAPVALPPAQPVAVGDRPFVRLFPNLLSDLRRLPSASTAIVLGLGGAISLAARPNDDHVSEHASAGETDQIFAVGGMLGSGYVQVGGAVATFALGRLAKHESIAHAGADLIRAQVMTGLLTHSIKLAVRRNRPEGESGSYSFPSGHASGSFASATVLWRHFGWKLGVPATLIAAYSSGARLHENQHYLSDVAFGAALGIVGGRTVTMGHRGPKLMLTPAPVRGGGGVFVTLLER